MYTVVDMYRIKVTCTHWLLNGTDSTEYCYTTQHENTDKITINGIVLEAFSSYIVLQRLK